MLSTGLLAMLRESGVNDGHQDFPATPNNQPFLDIQTYSVPPASFGQFDAFWNTITERNACKTTFVMIPTNTDHPDTKVQETERYLFTAEHLRRCHHSGDTRSSATEHQDGKGTKLACRRYYCVSMETF